MTQFPNKFKKPCFQPIFPIFGANKIFLENLVLSRTTSYGFLAPCQKLEKANDTIQRKHPDRQKDGRTERRKDGQTLFYWTLPATAGGPISLNQRAPLRLSTESMNQHQIISNVTDTFCNVINITFNCFVFLCSLRIHSDLFHLTDPKVYKHNHKVSISHDLSQKTSSAQKFDSPH